MLRQTDQKTLLHAAFLDASDYIEAHPEEFNFMSTAMPHPCKTPGCAIGWVAYFAGEEATKIGTWTSFRWGFDNEEDFYAAMYELTEGDWTSSAPLCAQGMRAYAREYLS